jgi:hypothetical protein
VTNISKALAGKFINGYDMKNISKQYLKIKEEKD